MKEIWKDIKGYEGLYQISNLGRVKSNRGILKPGNVNDYKQITLCKNNKKKYLYIHRLVAQAFILNPEDKPDINHIDGNKSNNNISNLEWVTSSENIKHAFKIGLNTNNGVKNSAAKLNENDVLNIRASKLSDSELSKLFNVGRTTINRIRNRKLWNHI